MSEISDVVSNIYEEDLNEHTTLNLAAKSLEILPDIKNDLLCVLYLQNNKLRTLPEDFFPTLPSLMYLDLRDNSLTDLPKSIKNHLSLTHLLLQNNCLTSLPDELGTVSLKVLQLNGNPLMYPPKEVLSQGLPKIIKFLHDKFIDKMFAQSQTDISEDNVSVNETASQEGVSYNSVTDQHKIKNNLTVQFSEKEVDESTNDVYYDKMREKCPKLDFSRSRSLPAHFQSSKYLKPLYADGRIAKEQKIQQNYLKELAMNKHKDLLATREKILQERKNLETLKNWRTEYRYRQHFRDGAYRLKPDTFPYDTNPEYMTFLSREDIEKDLPDKYRKSIVRRSKHTVPRKAHNDVHLAMKIKQLFENLEAIDLNRDGLTPRTEQRVLLNEIQKISEIKQKLNELTTTNQRSLSMN